MARCTFRLDTGELFIAYDFVIPLPNWSIRQPRPKKTFDYTEKEVKEEFQLKDCHVVLERLSEKLIEKALIRSAKWDSYVSQKHLQNGEDTENEHGSKDPEFTPMSQESDESSNECEESNESSELHTPSESEDSDWSKENIKVKRKEGRTFVHGQEVSLTSTGKIRQHRVNKAKRIKLAKYSCDKCSFNCSSQQALKVHLSTHGKNAPHLPCSCGLEFFSRYDLDVHKFNDHQGYLEVERTYRLYCRPCKETFPSELQFDLHVFNHVTVTSDKFTCLSCKSFSTHIHESFKRHAIESHKFHLCNFCERSFAKLHQLESHCTQFHADFTSPFKCDLCEFSCYAFGSYVEHRESSHALIWKYSNLIGFEECRFCIEESVESVGKFEMSQVTSYIEHMAEKHVSFNPFQCKLCEFR